MGAKRGFMLPRGLVKEYFQVLAILLRCLDGVAVIAAGFVAYYYKFGTTSFSSHYLIALATGALLTAIVFHLNHIYESARVKGFWDHISRLSQAVVIVLILLAGLAFLSKTGEKYSREWFGLWALFSIVLLISFRGCLLFFLRVMRSHGWNERRVIVIGAGELAVKLINTVQQSLWTGFRIVTIFDDDPEDKPKTLGGITVIKTPADINQYFADKKNISIDEVWLALPLRAEDRVKTILQALHYHAVTTRFVLDIFGLDLLNHSITDFAGFPVLNVCATPMVGMNRVVKAIEDRLLASAILLAILPLLLIIAIAVKLSSSGPIFYRQKRIGWNGKEFEMLKFRTMPVDAESKSGPVWAKKDEDRATKIGAFLRRLSLDELPQFINVLRGDMSIVGPRPERPHFVEQFKDEIPRYMQKHMVKAGITGWAQVNGWRGNTSLQKRIEYDLYYIENWSFIFDLKIILMTFFRGFINKNAY